MHAALEQHPDATRWAGADDKYIFGISVVSFTDRDVSDGDVKMFRITARLNAAKEMLFAKVLLDKYAEIGLTDANTLREAVADALEVFNISGKVTYTLEETFTSGNRIVGIVVADRSNVTATMTEPTRMEAVRSAYRDVVHRHVKRLMANEKFVEALQHLSELQQAKLLERAELFDVLRCFVGLDKAVDAERIVQSLIAGNSDDVNLFYQLVALTAMGKGNEFRTLTRTLHAEIDRLAPPEQTAEQVLQQLLNELLGASPVH